MAVHRRYLTQVRLERSVSSAIADLDRYRKTRIERHAEIEPKANEMYQIAPYMEHPRRGQ